MFKKTSYLFLTVKPVGGAVSLQRDVMESIVGASHVVFGTVSLSFSSELSL